MSDFSFGGGSIGSFAGCDGDGCDDCDCDCGDCSCPDCDCGDCSCPDCDCDCCTRCWDEVCFRCLAGVYHCMLEGCENTVCCCFCDSSTATDGRRTDRHDSCHDDDLVAMGMIHQYNHELRPATTGGAQVSVVQTQQPGKGVNGAPSKEPKKKKKAKKEGDGDDEEDESDEEIDGEEYERRVMAGEVVTPPVQGAGSGVQGMNNPQPPPLEPDEVKMDRSAESPEEPKVAPGERGQGSSGLDRTEESSSSSYHGASSRGAVEPSASLPEAPSVDTNYPTVAPPSYDDAVTSQPESRDDVV